MAKQEQYYLYLGNQERVPVSKDVYLYHQRWAASERYHARRNTKVPIRQLRHWEVVCT